MYILYGICFRMPLRLRAEFRNWVWRVGITEEDRVMGCIKHRTLLPLCTFWAPLSDTFLQGRKDVVNQCLESGLSDVRTPAMPGPQWCQDSNDASDVKTPVMSGLLIQGLQWCQDSSDASDARTPAMPVMSRLQWCQASWFQDSSGVRTPAMPVMSRLQQYQASSYARDARTPAMPVLQRCQDSSDDRTPVT